jgi:hypothetical protein
MARQLGCGSGLPCVNQRKGKISDVNMG